MAVKTSSSISRMAMKAMGLFGGVQIVQIVCSLIRVKLVALWIGPVGVGLFGLFNQALEMLNTGTNLGIRNSSVRDISQALEERKADRIAKVITVVRRWSMWLGLGGALLTLALAPILSEITFGSTEHMWGFVALSVAVLLMALTNGEYAVLQGTTKLKRLASVTMWGTLCGLVISIPLFYLLREKSIVPSILAYAACCAVAAFIFKDKEYPKSDVSRKETIKTGEGFVKLGIYMTLGSFVTILASYVFMAWLNHVSGTKEVGLYQAGYTLVNKYAGLILSALGMEYYPRLARVAHSKMRLKAFVSQEINISMIVMAPIIALFILLRSEIVWLLYTAEFKVILTFVSWALIGTVFRTLSWCIAFVILAKGSGKIYLVTETLSAIVGLGFNIGFYQLWGLTGLGISFLAWYVVYTLIVGYVYVRVYHLKLISGCTYNLVWTLVISASVMWTVESGLTAAAIVATAISIAVSIIAIGKVWKK
jgi:O-antigen/teichoic acid export membrane protein